MNGVNRVFLLGHLGRDPETRYTQAGKVVTNLSVATSERYKSDSGWKEKTEWHRCVLWGSENLVKLLQKGTKVHVEGSLQTRSWESKSGEKRYSTEVHVIALSLVGDATKQPVNKWNEPPDQDPTNGYDIPF